jgi:hypothetical protein
MIPTLQCAQLPWIPPLALIATAVPLIGEPYPAAVR